RRRVGRRGARDRLPAVRRVPSDRRDRRSRRRRIVVASSQTNRVQAPRAIAHAKEGRRTMATQSAGESARAAESGQASVRSLPGLAEKIMFRDLAADEAQLRQEDEWQRMGRNAMTLVKYPDLRVVLTVMKAGSRIERNRDET